MTLTRRKFWPREAGQPFSYSLTHVICYDNNFSPAITIVVIFNAGHKIHWMCVRIVAIFCLLIIATIIKKNH